MPPKPKGTKKLPKQVMGIPTPVVIVAGVAAVAYLYLRSTSASDAPAAGAAYDPGGGFGGRGSRGGRGPRGPAGKRGKPGRTIRKVVLICPKGYHRVPGRGCVPVKHKPRHPAHPKLRAQR